MTSHYILFFTDVDNGDYDSTTSPESKDYFYTEGKLISWIYLISNNA